MKRVAGGFLLFITVFVLALLWGFPLDALVAGQIQTLEQRTGVRISWQSARWSIFGTTLGGVVVRDAGGRPALELMTLAVMPRLGFLEARGAAAWGPVEARVASDSVDLVFRGYPVPGSPRLPLEGGSLDGQLHHRPSTGQVDGRLALSGRIKFPPLYEGRLNLDATLRLVGSAGTAALDVSGDALRGRADSLAVEIPPGGLEDLRVSGPLRLDLKGMTTWVNLTVKGRDVNVQLAPR